MTSRALPLVLPKGVTKALVATAVAGAALTGFMGFLHTKPGRPLRGIIFGESCPLGMGQALTPEMIDRSRAKGLSVERGTTPAPSRRALGFELGAATRATVEAWATAGGHSCKPLQLQKGLRCEAVAPASLPSGARGDEATINAVEFFLDRSDRLTSIVVLHGKRSPDVAAAWYNRHAKRLREEFGATSEGLAEVAPGTFVGRLYAARAKQRFSDLRVMITATSLGQEVSCTEQYNLIEDIN